MKNRALKIICTASLLVSYQYAQANGQGVETIAQPSVRDASDKAASSNQMGSAMSMLMGAQLVNEAMGHFARCPKSGSQCAKGAMKAGMAMMSFKQGGAHGSSALGAFNTGFNTDGIGNLNNPYGTGTVESSLLKDPSFVALSSNLAALKKGVNGNTFDAKTGKINTADGKSYNASDFESNSKMASAGLAGGAIAGINDYMKSLSKSIESKAEKLKLGSLSESNGYEEGAGGMNTSSLTEAATDAAAYAAPVAATDLGSDRDPSSVAGMQKNYNGEPIGVAADSIFLMMNRRYKVKESQESFYSEKDMALQK